MRPIVPNLWFDADAEEAVAFYLSVFPDSEVLSTARYPEGANGPAGSVMSISFSLGGTRFVAINGGPLFPQTEAVSFQVDCADQAEVDRYWEALVEGGGTHSRCGWLKDRFGVSWQVVPEGMDAFFTDPDADRVQRATTAMLAMGKIDVAALRAAADG